MAEIFRSNSHTIRLRVHETNRPVPSLMVTWYATADRVVRDAISDPSKWDVRRRDDIDALGLRRIGSAITDDSGTARLSLRAEPEAVVAGRRELNLWYTVRTPDIADTRCCGRTIHVACELIPLDTNQEELLVRIPASSLASETATQRASVIVDANIQSADLTEALRAVEGAPAPPNARVRGSVGRARNKEIAERVDAAARTRRLLERRRSAATGLDIRVRGKKGQPQFGIDKGTGNLVVQDPKTQAEVPLVFDGIERYTNDGLTESQIECPHVLVDETKGRVRLALPKVPDVLVARAAPSRLRRYLRSVPAVMARPEDEGAGDHAGE